MFVADFDRLSFMDIFGGYSELVDGVKLNQQTKLGGTILESHFPFVGLNGHRICRNWKKQKLGELALV